jgi:hypothetical protein
MAANKYPSRKTSTSKRKARAVPQRGVPLSDLEVRLKAPPHAGGPIRDVRPSAKVLQGLIPPASIVSVKSGLVARTDSAQPYLGPGVAGFAWDVPAPGSEPRNLRVGDDFFRLGILRVAIRYTEEFR